MDRDWEMRVRTRVFDHLRDLRERHGGAVPSNDLEQRVDVDGVAVALMSRQRGIHTPAQLEAAMTLKTSSANPYDDRVDPGYDGLIRYHYRDPSRTSRLAIQQAEADNAAVRRAFQSRLPVAYLWGVDRGWYLPLAPAEVVGDDPAGREFHLDVTELAGIDVHEPAGTAVDMAAEARAETSSDVVVRRYQARQVRVRVHQARFRQMVLRAYRRACAICSLRHAELLDAAHIVGDSEGGQPAVTNGLALCKLHHAAFDRHVLGIRPDLVVEINARVLAEVDGPMLLHGLQDFHGASLRVLPARSEQRPDAALLEDRWQQFREAT